MTLENKIKRLVENNCHSKAYAEVCKAFGLEDLEKTFLEYDGKDFLTFEETQERYRKYTEMLDAIKNKFGITIAKVVHSWLQETSGGKPRRCKGAKK